MMEVLTKNYVYPLRSLRNHIPGLHKEEYRAAQTPHHREITQKGHNKADKEREQRPTKTRVRINTSST
jgi:hypothetical protein